jgi:cytochrome P450
VSIIGRLRELGLPFADVQGVLGAILVAGVQTVSVALPRIVALLLDTGEWARVKAQPELVARAVDEGLRCIVPVPATIRIVSREATARGHRFRSGSRAFIFTYNLAKDSRTFTYPERFELARPGDQLARHLWYGSGPHFCLGFALAQRELCAVLETLLDAPGRLRIVRRRYAGKVLLPGYARLDLRAVAA